MNIRVELMQKALTLLERSKLDYDKGDKQKQINKIRKAVDILVDLIQFLEKLK